MPGVKKYLLCRECGRRFDAADETMKPGVCPACYCRGMKDSGYGFRCEVDHLPETSQFGGYEFGSSIVNPVL